MDKLTGIEVFVRVVEAGSFAGAAGQMGLSRAMVSKHVAELENRLGVRLLHRTTRRLSLTEAGQGYHTRCQEILALVQEADAEAANLTAAPRGVLRINAPVSFGALHIAPCLPDYHALHPDVRLDFTVNDRAVDLVEEGYDLAVRVGRLADSSLRARELSPARLVLCAAPSYLDRYGRPNSADALSDHACMAYAYAAEGPDWRLIRGDETIRIRRKPVMVVNNGDVAANAAVAGLGIALLPTFIIAPHLRSGALEQVLPDYNVPDLTISAVYPAGRHLPAKVRTFIDFLVQRFGPEPYWDAGLEPFE